MFTLFPIGTERGWIGGGLGGGKRRRRGGGECG